MSVTAINECKGPPAPISELPFFRLISDWHEESNSDAGNPTDHFITGIVCLQPVSKSCVSRLLDLLQDKPKVAAPATPEEAQGALHLLEALTGMMSRWGELFSEGIRHYLTPPPAGVPITPRRPEAFRPKTGEYFEMRPRRPLKDPEVLSPPPEKKEVECEVKKDASGEIRVECTALGKSH